MTLTMSSSANWRKERSVVPPANRPSLISRLSPSTICRYSGLGAAGEIGGVSQVDFFSVTDITVYVLYIQSSGKAAEGANAAWGSTSGHLGAESGRPPVSGRSE